MNLVETRWAAFVLLGLLCVSGYLLLSAVKVYLRMRERLELMTRAAEVAHSDRREAERRSSDAYSRLETQRRVSTQAYDLLQRLRSNGPETKGRFPRAIPTPRHCRYCGQVPYDEEAYGLPTGSIVHDQECLWPSILRTLEVIQRESSAWDRAMGRTTGGRHVDRTN